MNNDHKSILLIFAGLAVIAFIISVAVVAGNAVYDSSVNAREHACESVPSSQRPGCINDSHPTGGVEAVNACNTAASNWSATFPASNSFPYWQECMKDLLAGKTFKVPTTTKGKT